MRNFTYHNPTKILFGKDTTDRLAEEMKSRGKNVLFVYGGGSIKKNDCLQASASTTTQEGKR